MSADPDTEATAAALTCLAKGIPLDPLPPPRQPRPDIAHAPARRCELSSEEQRQAVRNSLRYFPSRLHQLLAGEFAAELQQHGHIYMYRFVPAVPLKAYNINCFPARLQSARAVQLMICNNLDPAVAQFPEELVTYGGNGQVFSNWAQFWVTMQLLSQLDEGQTLSLYSGHPMGLFPSPESAPRLVITNGMMVPAYSTQSVYDRLFAMGCTQFGQMTAGSFCYIGPQGIVHGTVLTLMNAGRRFTKNIDTNNTSANTESSRPPLVFVSSGLGGMSGAQPKAAAICGFIGVIAEVSEEALDKRISQGWADEKITDLDELISRLRQLRSHSNPTAGRSLAFLGNVVDIWERLAAELDNTGELLVDVGSDQTSCHNPWQGGYYPAGVGYDEAREMMRQQPAEFKEKVRDSLRRQVSAIRRLSDAGMYFFDYGNAFLLQASRAGADVLADGEAPSFGEGDGNDDGESRLPRFRFASYVQHIMGDIFSLGFGPFRWVCTSGDPADLDVTDAMAGDLLQRLHDEEQAVEEIRQQYADNLLWIRSAKEHQLVVGSQARILYSDLRGRQLLAKAFNEAVAEGKLRGPVVISRDHHDVSGTDSPYRETSNITDGSNQCADMSVHNFVGDAIRGATWVSLHNGGGTGWGLAINGGFGLVLDGSESAAAAADGMLQWDVINGVARRSWGGHPLARVAVCREQVACDRLCVTMPTEVDEQLLQGLF